MMSMNTKQTAAVSKSGYNTKELVLDEKHGIIMKDNNLPTVIKALQKALQDRKIREQGIELTYQRLQKYFTWDKVAEKVMKL